MIWSIIRCKTNSLCYGYFAIKQNFPKHQNFTLRYHLVLNEPKEQKIKTSHDIQVKFDSSGRMLVFTAANRFYDGTQVVLQSFNRIFSKSLWPYKGFININTTVYIVSHFVQISTLKKLRGMFGRQRSFEYSFINKAERKATWLEQN